MKKLCLFIFISFIAFPVLAQSEKGYVYLKNGTILKGKYEYFNNLEKIKIESAGNLWIFNANEVDLKQPIKKLNTFFEQKLVFWLETRITVKMHPLVFQHHSTTQ